MTSFIKEINIQAEAENFCQLSVCIIINQQRYKQLKSTTYRGIVGQSP